jgi:hypothetical protein
VLFGLEHDSKRLIKPLCRGDVVATEDDKTDSKNPGSKALCLRVLSMVHVNAPSVHHATMLAGFSLLLACPASHGELVSLHRWSLRNLRKNGIKLRRTRASTSFLEILFGHERRQLLPDCRADELVHGNTLSLRKLAELSVK